MAGFAATIGDWCEKVERSGEAIFKQSVQELVSVAQRTRSEGGRMRVDTGFMRASLMASTASMPAINPSAVPPPGAAPNSIPYNSQPVEAVIIGAELGGPPIYLGYTAAYAGFREYGANNQPADAFVRTAAQQWPQIVAAKEAELKSRLGL